MSRTRLAGLATLLVLVLGACSAAPIPSTSSGPSPSLAALPSPSAIASSSAAAASCGAANQALLYQRLTGAGGGIYFACADGSDARPISVEGVGRGKLHPDWAPDGTRITFLNEEDSTIWIADVDGTHASRIAECCDFPAWSPDGTSIAYTVYEPGALVGPGASRIDVLDLATGTVHTAVRLERPLLADVPRWSPDSSQLVIGVDQQDDAGNETGSAIAIVPASGDELRYLTGFEQFAYSPDWSWAKDQIVFSTAATDIFVINPDGSGLRQLTHNDSSTSLRDPSWIPDGSGIIAVRDGTARLVYIDLETGALEESGGDQVAHPRLRPATPAT